MAEQFIDLLETKYKEIYEAFHFPEEQHKYYFNLCRSVEEYIEKTGKKREEYQSWMVGNSNVDTHTISILSPKASEDAACQDMKKVATHELVHMVFDDATKVHEDDSEVWLAEGIAILYAEQTELEYISEQDYPQLTDLIGFDNFVDNQGYDYAGIYVKHFIRRYGFEKFLEVYRGGCEWQELIYDKFESDAIKELKYILFLENAQLLFDAFHIKPLLYGFLGLEVLLQRDLQSDDIDILIPGELLHEKWESFKSYLEMKGYTLIDLHEHTFVKDGVAYSYARIEELKDFAGVDSFVEKDFWLLLTLQDYLKVYEMSLKDGYRQNNKNKNDMEKINIIKSVMQCRSNNESIDYVEGIKQEEINFPKLFASYEEREYGILFYMEDHRVMLLTAENAITTSKRLDIRVLNDWDEQVATDILIPSGEPWEIEVTKKRLEKDMQVNY